MQYFGKIKWLILGILIGSYACSDSTVCLSNQQAIQTTFYSVSSGSAEDSTLTGIYVWGYNRTDSLIYDSLNVSEMFLPANLNRDTVIYIIKQETLFNDNVREEYDTLEFHYSRELQYISGECGMTYNLLLNSVLYTTNIIDSVRIDYANVNYGENFENVKIYIEH